MLETKAFDLAKIFLSFYRTHTRKIFRLGSVKKSKWWNFFVQTIEKFGDRKEWNSYEFVGSIFEKYGGQVYPPQLPTEAAWSTFLEYRHRFRKSVKMDKVLAINLLNVYQNVKRWSFDNGHKKINFNAFINDSYNTIMIERKSYDLTLFTVSKSFHKWLKNYEEGSIITEDEIKNKRALIFSHKKILYRLQEIMGDEFV